MKKNISLIVACDAQYGIGKKGSMPWRSKADFAHFKRITMSHPMITGRKNFDDMGILPGRDVVVLTRDTQWQQDSKRVHVAHTVEQAMDTANTLYGNEEIFIVGGAAIYEEFLERGIVDTIYLSRMRKQEYNCDTFFPKKYLHGFTEVASETIQQETDKQPEIVFSYMQKTSHS